MPVDADLTSVIRMSRRALVLGGGGVTGVAWEVGMLLGLAESGVDLGTADLLVGTSAGSVVAAQAACEVPIDQMFARQVTQAPEEITARLGGPSESGCSGPACSPAGIPSGSGSASAHWPAPPAPCPSRTAGL